MNNNKPIRVLQCVSNMDRAGIETMLMNFYRKIDKNKIQFDFLCNKSKIGDYDDEIKKMGGRIYVSPGLNPFKWWKYQKFMNSLFKSHPEYRIIHCQNEAMGFPALYAAKKNNIPIRISHSHNTTIRFDIKWLIKLFYKFKIKNVANYYFSCSKAAGNYLFKDKESLVINNAIDYKKFQFDSSVRNKIRDNLNISNKYVIGHVGRFEPQKNHEFLIDIFSEYSKLDEDAILLLIGCGSLENKIKTKVRKLKLANKVIFLGNISNVNEFYQAMDLFILPSLHEGLPVVGVEAQFADLDCLLSNKITRETKFNDKMIFYDLDLTALEWAKKICSIKEQNNDRKIVYCDKYDVNIAVKKLENLYLELFGRGN